MSRKKKPGNFLLKNNLPSVLMQFFEDFPRLIFPQEGEDAAALLLVKEFLFSTNDDARLKYALKLSKKLLKSTDIDDAQYFRESLLRREISGNINYEKQRDHTSHTLYNYLIGFYFYENSTCYRKSFLNYTKRINREAKDDIFISIWPFVSILHDIGYIFEGSIKSLDLDNSFKELQIAQDIINDHFKSKFWREVEITSTEEKQKIKDYVAYPFKEYNSKSIYEVADNFTELNLSDKFTDLLEHSISNLYEKNISIKKLLSNDVFELWASHYRFFNNNQMVKRISSLRSYFCQGP
ncbi:MAG: hypothetical protein HF312_13405 [Ignavibacteria bacterium]|jgi:hypothetical protein|nr:hypothetical protein [Ignavibacteria bacterium]MCU7521211.1 hypothetical protein [Ignavibacteria bacterium]